MFIHLCKSLISGDVRIILRLSKKESSSTLIIVGLVMLMIIVVVEYRNVLEYVIIQAK
jgi:hypothetical protein